MAKREAIHGDELFFHMFLGRTVSVWDRGTLYRLSRAKVREWMKVLRKSPAETTWWVTVMASNVVMHSKRSIRRKKT